MLVQAMVPAPGPVVALGARVVVLASVVLSVLRSLVTYGNLVLRREADLLHLEHGLLRRREHTFDMRRLRGGTLRQPLLVRLLGGARLMNYGDASSIVNSPIS
mgnify:CR=1 FL=1